MYLNIIIKFGCLFIALGSSVGVRKDQIGEIQNPLPKFGNSDAGSSIEPQIKRDGDAGSSIERQIEGDQYTFGRPTKTALETPVSKSSTQEAIAQRGKKEINAEQKAQQNRGSEVMEQAIAKYKQKQKTEAQRR